MRLLLVEDDLELQANLKQHLVDANYTVDTADDGEIGLFQGREYNTTLPSLMLACLSLMASHLSLN